MSYLTEYNPEWPHWFGTIADSLLVCSDCLLEVEHIGSTSIPGMIAKPIIDIDIVAPIGKIGAVTKCLEQIGYAHRGDLGCAGREAYKACSAKALALPTHHLYACEESALHLRRHLSFRDYLRAHGDEAQKLIDFKRHLCFELQLTRAEYVSTKEKSPMVSALADRALAWYDSVERLL